MNDKQILEYENQILDLINNKDDITTSDLQGVISFIVKSIFNYGRDYQLINDMKENEI